MGLVIETRSLGEATTVEVIGEVDVSNAAELRDALDAALVAATGSVSADLSEVPYIDSTGIGVLVGFAHRAAEANVAFSVANPQRNVMRVLTLLGLTEELGIAG